MSAHPAGRRRARPLAAALGALAIGGTAILGGSAASLAATGDDESLISVIQAASPAVVSIQVTSGQRSAAGSQGEEQGSEQEGAESSPEPGESAQPSASPETENGSNEGQGDQPGIGDIPGLQGLPFDQIPGLEQLPFGGQMPMGGSGSGVIVDPSGLIITNGHVVDGADTVTVVLSDGTRLDGEVAGVDTFTDFALVRVQADKPLPTIQLGESSTLRVGQRAIVIGNPLGDLPGSVSTGIVSGLERRLDVADMMGGGESLNHLIQTDAAVNPGNSGGALLDGDGKLIGIATAQAGLSDGIGFALPIDLAKPIITQVAAGEPITRPWIGIRYLTVDAQVAADQGLPVESGAWIPTAEGQGDSPVVAGSPAEAAGLQAGDIITALDGKAIDAQHPLDVMLLQQAPGDTITLTVLRDGAEQSIQVTLGTRPSDLAG